MIRKSNVEDAVLIQELINSSAEKEEVLPRSLNDIFENLRDFFVYEEDGHIYGCCALHITWKNLAEIRSLVVDYSKRTQGIGQQLVENCCKDAQALKVKKVFLLTEIAAFFEKLGFVKIDKSLLPHKTWSDCVQCIQFPNCNEVAMVKEL